MVKKIMLITLSVILWMILSFIPCMAESGGYIVDGSSEEIESLRLDMKRINTGSYIAASEKEKVTPVKKKSPKKRRGFWETLTGWGSLGKKKKEVKKETTVIKTSKTMAETALEASKRANDTGKKAEAIAKTSLEVSKKAEKTAIDALNAAKRAEATANEAIAATNRAIEIANKAVATTNKAISEINKLAEGLKKETEKEKTYRVKKGDSLSGIALKIYKDRSLWKKIFNANRDEIKDPSLIRLGQVLKIPK